MVRRGKRKLRVGTGRGSPSSKFGWRDLNKEGKEEEEQGSNEVAFAVAIEL